MMNLVSNGIDTYVKITPQSNLNYIPTDYNVEDHTIRMSGEFEEDFLSCFSRKFSFVKKLRFSNELEEEYNFLYELKRLEYLTLHFYRDIKCTINFSKIAQLKELGMNWYYKYYKNLEAQGELEHLSISDFTEKDFGRIPKFEKLKSFTSIGGKLKTLDDIKCINNIVALEISAHRSLTDISQIQHCKNLKYIEINTCWKMADFSPISELKELEVLRIIDCKNLESIKFVKDMPNLRHLEILGTSLINDLDTTPAEHVPVFLGSLETKYNKHYPEKEENIQPYGRKQFY